jgi:hypothetical protein
MSVVLTDGVIELSNDCAVEDADTLLQLLLTVPEARIDWRKCESAHAAVIQVLLAARAHPTGPPAGEFLNNQVRAVLDRNLP